MTTGRDYLGYYRKSKGRAGIPRQRHSTERHISDIGGRIAGEFEDADRTAYHKPGDPLPEREGFTALLKTLAGDTSDPPLGVAAWHADRLIRSGGDAERIIEVCNAGRHPVETPGGGSYELWTATGRRRFRDDATAAAYEVDHLRERVMEQKREHAIAGEWPGGLRPFGWNLIPAAPGSGSRYEGLELNEAEAVELSRAASLVLSGTSLYVIANDWNARGITNSRGGRWRGGEVRRTLLRPWNAGLAVYQGTETGTPTTWPAILDVAQFRDLQYKFADPSRRTNPVTRRVWPGSGLYLCGWQDDDGAWCDTPLRARHVARSAVPLDEYVGEIVCAWLEQPEALALARRPPKGVDTTSLHARAGRLRERLEVLARMFAAGSIDGAQLEAGSAEIRAQIAVLEARIAAATPATPLDGLPGPDVRARWAEFIDRGDIGRMQAIISRLFIVRVKPVGRGRPKGSGRGGWFDHDAIDITWKQQGGK